MSAPWLKSLVARLPVSVPVRVRGQSYWVPLGGGLGFRLLSVAKREPGLASVIEQLLRARPGAVVDVGANVGQTLLLVKSIDPGRAYLGFEPNPACYSYVDHLVRHNRLPGVGLACCGLGAQAETVPLQIRTGMPELSSTTPGFRPSSFYDDTRLVPIRRGDDALKEFELDAIALVKIDVEGGELDVVRGLQETLARFRPPILFEVLPDRIFATNESLPPQLAAQRRARAEAIESELGGLGYSISRIRADGQVEPISRLAESREVAAADCNYIARVEPVPASTPTEAGRAGEPPR